LPIPSGLHTEQIQQLLLESLTTAPRNPLTDLAWQTYQSLVTTPASGESYNLRTTYLGQIGHILAAARWANAPVAVADCENDIDWDGQAECILASDSLFTTFESEGGYLAFAFAKLDNEFHQLIAPSYQLTTGLSDPSLWVPENGLLADPNQILGACADPLPNWQNYQPLASPGMITMTSSDQQVNKVFELLPNGIRIIISNQQAVQRLLIPLSIDPWQRFAPAWGTTYSQEEITSWGIQPGPTLSISATAPLTIQPFTASYSVITSPEDPNYNYPPGHFLPFPMALVEIKPQQPQVVIDIQVIP
jgi:hypothetical protein